MLFRSGHRTFNWQNWTQLRLLSKSGPAPKFGYYFHRVPPFPSDANYCDNKTANLGAFHTAEIPYAFDHLSARAWPWRETDRGLANTLSSYWVNFATNGDPNGAGLPPWPRFGEASQGVMLFGEEQKAGPMPLLDKFAFWDRYFARLRQSA